MASFVSLHPGDAFETVVSDGAGEVRVTPQREKYYLGDEVKVEAFPASGGS